MSIQPQINDPVNHPKHYKLFPDLEAIDIIRRSLTPEEFAGYCKGNTLKYRLRAGDKDDVIQDIDKSNWYRNYLNKQPTKHSLDVTTEEEEAWNEKRMDIIGQNGGDGDHYVNLQEILNPRTTLRRDV